jgi:2-haloacid dehalogenase
VAAHILAFDVNETLLDLKALDPHFERIFGDRSVRGLWFGQFIQSALVSIVTNTYTPFGQIGGAALDMIAERRGVALKPEDKQAIVQTYKPFLACRPTRKCANSSNACTMRECDWLL